VASGKAWRKGASHLEKLHLAVDADTGMIMASTLTGNDVGDPSQVAPLLDQIEATIASVTADGAYDGMPTYDVVAGHGEDVRVIIPPHVTAVLSAEAEHNPSQRDQHILSIAARGRLGWQEETDYGQRALVETAMGRYKAIIGPRLRARSFSGQPQAEAAVGVANPQPHAGRGTPGLRSQSHPGSLRHFPAQYRVPILRDPDQVILDLPNRVPTRPILPHLRSPLYFRSALKLTA
jgi:hypothetical protein